MIKYIVLVIILSIIEIMEIKKDNGSKGIILYLVLASFALFLGISYIKDPLGFESISQYIFKVIGINY